MHLAPWFDLTTANGNPVAMQTRLSRCLEMLGCSERVAGIPFGGRVMGKVNVNTVWSTNLSGGTAGQDNGVLMRAVADPLSPANQAQSGNFFNQTDVDNYFGRMALRRTLAGTANGGTPTGVPAPDVVVAGGGQKDRPFWSLGGAESRESREWDWERRSVSVRYDLRTSVCSAQWPRTQSHAAGRRDWRRSQ